MATSASRVQRLDDIDAKTAQGNSLVTEILPMLNDLDAQGLKEVRAYLEARLKTVRKEVGSTKVMTRGTPLDPSQNP